MAMTQAQLTAYLDHLAQAASWTEVFGAPSGHATPGDAYAVLRASYRREMRTIHPDLHAVEPGLAALANRAAVALNAWLERAELALGVAARPGARSSVIDVAGESIELGDLLAEGDLCDVYDATGRGGRRLALKVVRDVANNDLVENEAEVLARLHGSADPDQWAAFSPYLSPIEHDLVMGDGRRANLMRRTAPADGWHSLADVMDAYPNGVDARTVGWMFSRLLEVLSWLHGEGVFHGAILPEHVLIEPDDHGAKLVDWCYAGRLGTRLAAVSAPYRRWYPTEVFDRLPVGPGLDLALAARTVIAVAGGSPRQGTLPSSHPAELGDLLRGCLLPDAGRRYADAWLVYERWRETLRRVFGGIRFHPFSMPNTSTRT